MFNVVIVNWNGLQFCKDLFEDISKISDELFLRCIVVDNASSDGSVEFIRENYPKINLITSNENLGYAKGNNIGLRHCTEDYVFLLNNDTRIADKDFFKKIISFLEKNPSIGAMTPTLVLPDGRLQTGACGFDKGLISYVAHFFFLSKISIKYFPPLYLDQRVCIASGKETLVDWVSGACLVARRDVLVKVGGVPSDYFMYAEDIKLCRNIKQIGYSVAYFPGAKLMHIHGGSETEKSTKTRWITSTLSEYEQREGSGAKKIAQMIFFLGFLARSFIYYWLYLFSRKNRFKVAGKKMWMYAMASL
ncbi:glycosyltransferase family 2 protein [Variovorax ginsengisoli]|uniref:GT2 family glycosyltransferase n=1 Tax=Variovorax ginsengisoli TaxID=363844 RepID=A0ABT9SFS5_9BURK|nr:glycosyltransferase family 2 protein [Variovorax ginsengisoli]MDP9902212.1 GT2 family glycosyltransferase [Variovorax ginsengisoli]